MKFLQILDLVYSWKIQKMSLRLVSISIAQKMNISIKDFFGKFDQTRKNCAFGRIYWRNT